MSRKSKRNRDAYPLELVLTHTGTAELRDADDEVLWASDDDDDFKEEFPDFLVEDDFDDVLEFLLEAEVITEKEYDKFDSEEWDMNIESLPKHEVEGPGDDDDDNFDDDD